VSMSSSMGALNKSGAPEDTQSRLRAPDPVAVIPRSLAARTPTEAGAITPECKQLILLIRNEQSMIGAD
jgi:hypothetical protein